MLRVLVADNKGVMLSEELILAALRRMAAILEARGVVGEIAIFGGAAMVLAFHARQTTKDVDAIFAPVQDVREAAQQVASEMNLPNDWINDAVKGFLSDRGELTDRTITQLPCLRILTPTPEYLLAMKVLSARTARLDAGGDKRDILFLIDQLGLNTPDEVMSVVQRYYDPSRVLPRSVYLLDEIFEQRNKGKE